MLKDLSNSFSLVICSMSSLSDLFENDVLKLSYPLGRDLSDIAADSPSLQNHINEVIILLGGKSCIDICIVFKETTLSDLTTLSSGTDQVLEVVIYSLLLFLSGEDSGVGLSTVLLAKLSERDSSRSGLVEILPCMLYYG